MESRPRKTKIQNQKFVNWQQGDSAVQSSLKTIIVRNSCSFLKINFSFFPQSTNSTKFSHFPKLNMPQKYWQLRHVGNAFLYELIICELLLLLLLHCFSHVRFCDPIDGSPPGFPSLGFSTWEHWSGLPFPSPTHESEKWKWSRSVVSDSSDPMDCSLPGSSIHGTFQAKVLEWGAIAFSDLWTRWLQNLALTVVKVGSNDIWK